MKIFEIFFFLLCLQIEHFPTRVSVHQSTYIKKTLKHFIMDKAHSLNFPMVVNPLNMKKDSFHPYENGENLLSPKLPYLRVINALMNFANCMVEILIFLSIY